MYRKDKNDMNSIDVNKFMRHVLEFPPNVTPSHRKIVDFVNFPSSFLLNAENGRERELIGQLFVISEQYPFFSLDHQPDEMKKNLLTEHFGISKPVHFEINLQHPCISQIRYDYEMTRDQSLTVVEIQCHKGSVRFPIERVVTVKEYEE